MKYLSACAAEALGTFTLIFLGAGSICINALLGDTFGLTRVAFAHGLAIFTMASALGHVSGGHFNPAVTAAMLFSGRQKPAAAGLYIASQLAGAAIAAGLLARIFGGFVGVQPFLGACDLSLVGVKGGIALEALMTFLLVTVIFGAALDSRGAKTLAPLAIGMTITGCIMLGGPLTGAALNPARAFGPALASGHWNNHLVYWIGPVLGALGASALYELRLKA